MRIDSKLSKEHSENVDKHSTKSVLSVVRRCLTSSVPMRVVFELEEDRASFFAIVDNAEMTSEEIPFCTEDGEELSVAGLSSLQFSMRSVDPPPTLTKKIDEYNRDVKRYNEEAKRLKSRKLEIAKEQRKKDRALRRKNRRG